MSELRDFRELAAAVQAIAVCRDAADVARLVVERAGTFAASERSLLLVRQKYGPARVVASLGLDEAALGELSLPLDDTAPVLIRRLLQVGPADVFFCVPLAQGELRGLLITHQHGKPSRRAQTGRLQSSEAALAALAGAAAAALERLAWQEQAERALADAANLRAQFRGRLEAAPDAAVISDATGEITLRDASERRRAEEAWRESEERFRSAFEHSPIAMALVGLDDRFLRVNRAFTAFTGYSEDELLALTFPAISHPEDLPADRAGLQELLDGAAVRFQMEKRYRHPQGHTLWGLLSVSLVRDREGQPLYFIRQIQDVTEQKRTLAMLRESEARFAAEAQMMTRLYELGTRLHACSDLRAAMEETLDASIALMRADMGNVQLLNPQSRTLEISVHRGFRQDFLDYFRTVSIDDASACGRAMRSGERILIEDVLTDPDYAPHRLIAASAGYRAVQSTPLIGRNHQLLGMLSTHWRTPHRPAERDLRLLDLYAREAAGCIEWMQLLESEHRKSEQLAVALREAHHRIKNNLQAVTDLLSLELGADDRSGSPHSLRASIERVAAISLVHDLLSQDTEIESVDVSQLAERLVPTVLRASSRSPAAVDLELSVPSVLVPSRQATALALILNELTSNAAKHAFSGRPEGSLEVRLDAEGADLRLTVQDDGPGLPPGFDLDTHASIGLQVVQTLVDSSLGGRLSLQSEKGLRVEVRFTADRGSARA